jgi:hypothetical protein
MPAESKSTVRCPRPPAACAVRRQAPSPASYRGSFGSASAGPRLREAPPGRARARSPARSGASLSQSERRQETTRHSAPASRTRVTWVLASSLRTSGRRRNVHVRPSGPVTQGSLTVASMPAKSPWPHGRMRLPPNDPAHQLRAECPWVRILSKGLGVNYWDTRCGVSAEVNRQPPAGPLPCHVSRCDVPPRPARPQCPYGFLVGASLPMSR